MVQQLDLESQHRVLVLAGRIHQVRSVVVEQLDLESEHQLLMLMTADRWLPVAAGLRNQLPEGLQFPVVAKLCQVVPTDRLLPVVQLLIVVANQVQVLLAAVVDLGCKKIKLKCLKPT